MNRSEKRKKGQHGDYGSGGPHFKKCAPRPPSGFFDVCV